MRFRLAFMFSCTALTLLLLLGLAVIYAVDRHFISEDNMILEEQSALIINDLHHRSDLFKLMIKYSSILYYSDDRYEVTIFDSSGNLFFNSFDKSTSSFPYYTVNFIGKNEFASIEADEFNFRILSKTITIDSELFTVVCSLNINHHVIFLNTFNNLILISVALTALIMGVIAWFVAKQGLKPLNILIEQTSKITVKNLSLPISNNNTYLEIIQLTNTFNDMLDRLNNSYQRLIGFSSDLAHELRSPLSTIKMQNQVILSQPRTVEVYQQLLQDNCNEIDQMTQMVNDMLFLAKADNGLILPNTSLFDVHRLMTSLIDYYNYGAQEKKITIQLSGQGKLYGDPSLLRRAFSNLINNAIIYGDEKSIITIAIHEQLNELHIIITNQGNVIAANHLPHIFERFYRADSARTHNENGCGLGLSITASILTAHQANITVTSANCQTCFKLIFPR